MDLFEAPPQASRWGWVALAIVVGVVGALYVLTMGAGTEPPPVRVGSAPVDEDLPAPAAANVQPQPVQAPPKARAAAPAAAPRPSSAAARRVVGSAAPDDALAIWARTHGSELRRLVQAGQRVRYATGGTADEFAAACRELGTTARESHAPVPGAERERLQIALRSTLSEVADRCKAAIEQRSAPDFKEGTRLFRQAERIWGALRPELRPYF